MNLREAWAPDTDIVNRDPNCLNEHLAITFEETLGEPDHTHSLDCVWRFSFKSFNLCKALCYLLATSLCGFPTAVCWGAYFACVGFCHIWQITPSIRAMELNCHIYRRLAGVCMSACVTPCCESCSTLFAAFKR